jgi:hypothetical protein
MLRWCSSHQTLSFAFLSVAWVVILYWRDGDPTWTKAWSLIQIGKIFDITSQRERAVAQYQLAIETGDNTDGAINQARELLEHRFEWPANQ